MATKMHLWCYLKITKKIFTFFSLPSEIPVCIKQNTGTPLRFPLVCGLAADKRLITIAVTLYKTDTLIQFGPFMLFIDNATPPPHRRPASCGPEGGLYWQLHRHCGGVQAATCPPPPHPTHPKSPGSLRAFTMKSTCMRNLTRCCTPMPIQLQTRWKSVTCFRLFITHPPTTVQPAQLDLFLVHAGKCRMKTIQINN